MLAVTNRLIGQTTIGFRDNCNRARRRCVCIKAVNFSHGSRAGCCVLLLPELIDSPPEYCLGDHRTRS